ncbi:hypothetical protein BGX27_003796 [Mortierella sp. AM989]|nr:hypothetical protein BGX27_003796 [Mortierella sp. AM989]
MSRYAHHTFPPTSSSDNSDSEDLYGAFETDDLPPSPDSEMISHPSDNEELSSSPLPAYPTFRSARNAGTDSRDTDEEEDQVFPSFSLSSQDFDQHQSSHPVRDSQVQDDFFLVEPSDLESSSRPLSSFSHHSDLEHPEDPMHFIYPSMALSHLPNESPLYGDEAQEHVIYKDSNPLRKSSSHTPSTHDIPVTIDSSLETILGDPKTSSVQNEPQQHNSSKEPHNLRSETKEEEWQEDKADKVDKERSFHEVLTASTAESSRAKSPSLNQSFTAADTGYQNNVETSEASIVQPPVAARSLLDLISQDRPAHDFTASRYVSINPSWSLASVMTGCFGFILAIILAGYLSAEYYHRSVYPAHVVVSEVNYVEDSRIAVAHLSVYTYKLKREARRNRSPGFHIRVLNDSKAWSLDEAPAHPLHLFGEPIVDCPLGGWCTVYVPSLHKRTKNTKSPFLCSDASYYLHIWFSNGTRTSDVPPEIFTTREGDGKKPIECISRTSGSPEGSQGTDDDADDTDDNSYFKSWMQQFQGFTGEVKAAVHQSYLALPWTDVQWNHFQPAIAELPNAFNMVLAYYQHSTAMITEMVRQWMNHLIGVGVATQERIDTVLTRARRNAKRIRDHVSLKVQQAVDQIHINSAFRGKHQLSHQAQTFKKAVRNQWGKLSLDNAVRKVDQLLADVEHDIAALMSSKDIRRRAGQLLVEAETSLEQIFNSEFIHKINRNVQQSVEQLKTSSTGNKAIRKAQKLRRKLQEQLKL